MPKKRQRLPEEVWTSIRQRYEQGTPVKELIAEYAMNESTFHWRRKHHNWAQPRQRASEALKRAVKDPTPDRVGEALDILESNPIEHDTSGSPPVPAPDDERSLANTRTMVLIRSLYVRLEALLRAPEVTSKDTAYRDRTRGLLDITNALERIQKIERKALGLDEGLTAVPGTVIIMAPGKEKQDEWSNVEAVNVLPLSDG